MAGGEPRLGTDSMYMGNHNSLLRSLQPIICQLHGYKNRTSENKIARYQPLDVKERRKLRLASCPTPAATLRAVYWPTRYSRILNCVLGNFRPSARVYGRKLIKS